MEKKKLELLQKKKKSIHNFLDTMLRFLFIFIFFQLIFSANTFAKKILTLNEAVSLAIKTNPQISAALKQRGVFLSEKYYKGRIFSKVLSWLYLSKNRFREK